MKKIKIILMASILLCLSCEKDEQGKWISYYKNKIGEGYVFYKFENDSIVPINNLGIEIISYARIRWIMFGIGKHDHTDVVYTNSEGKYSFKFAKKISNQKVIEYEINPYGPSDAPFGFIPSHVKVDINMLDKFNKISIDTIFFYRDPISYY